VAEFFICDVSNLDNVQKTVADILENFGKIDIVVNNAGIWTDDNIEKKNPLRRKDAFQVNALGNIQFTEEILTHFKEKNSGHIFNVISTAGASDTPAGNNQEWKTYGATKWAMTGYTNALRSSLMGTNIKVTGFYPGGFESNLYENAGRPNAHNQFWMMKTEDVADVIIFALTRPADMMIEKIVLSKVH
jgi:NADP-dependent 3-hydroxy acid dehydrogenase YdfG